MGTALRRFALLLLLIGVSASPIFSQEGQPPQPASPSLGFGMNLGIGVQSFDEPGGTVTYQSLGLSPDVSFGPFGIGLSITINYRFTGSGNAFEIRQADWIPSASTGFLELYLPKIKYIRWGTKSDPLFVKFGSIDDSTLGNGFIMSNYANTLFLPGDRHFGLNFNLDGQFFGFPFVGLETVVGNLAVFDVIGARLYARPLVTTGIPIAKNLEVGATYAVDTRPYLFQDPAVVKTPIGAFGGDVRLPLVYIENVFSLVTFADIASLDGKYIGGMLGFGGRLINFITYGAQLRVLGDGFIPVYFDATYDLYRATKYDLVQTGAAGIPGSIGWFASIGTSFFEDKIVLNIGLDSPFVTSASDPTLAYPHLRGIISIAEGLVPGISFDFSYDKKAIQTFAALISPQDAAIQARLNFKSGPAVISFVYKIVYDPTHVPDPWVVTSGLESSIQLF